MRQKLFLTPILLMICLTIAMTTTAQSDRQPITAANIEQLTQIGSFAGECATFHPDESVIATTAGLFDLDSGEGRIDLSDAPVEHPEWIDFSPDGQWVVLGSRIYAVGSGELALDFEYPQVFIIFSENGDIVNIHGITYDTQTWEAVSAETIPDFAYFFSTSGDRLVWRDYSSGNGIPTYLSPSGNYWVQTFEGIYDVETGQLIDLPPELNDFVVLESGVFSPDESIFFGGGEGVETYTAYHVPTFDEAYSLDNDMGSKTILYVPFSPDNRYFGVADDGIYETLTGDRLFEISGSPSFSLDNLWVVTSQGLYELATGQLKLEFSETSFVLDFSDDNTLVALLPLGVFDLLAAEQRFAVDETVRDMQFSADSSLLYGRAISQEILIYDTETGDVVQTLSGNSFLLSPQERFLAVQSDANCVVYAVE